MDLHPAEEATIRAFIRPERRPRYSEQMASPEPDRRRRMLWKLHHCKDIDPRFVFDVPEGRPVLDELCGRGAPSRCRLISADEGLDGRDMPLPEALRAVLNGFATIVCCIPGRLAYYRDEEGQREFLLARDEP